MANDNWVVDLTLKDKTGPVIRNVENNIKKLGQAAVNIATGGVSNIGSSIGKEVQGGIKDGLSSTGLSALMSGLGAAAGIGFAAAMSKALLKNLRNVGTGSRSALQKFPDWVANGPGGKDMFDRMAFGITSINPIIGRLIDYTKKLQAISRVQPSGNWVQVLGKNFKLAGMAVSNFGSASVLGNTLALMARAAPVSMGLASTIGKVGVAIAGAIPAIAGVTAGIAALAAAAVLAIPAMAGLQKAALDWSMPYLQAAGSLEAMRNGIKALSDDADKLIPRIEKLAKLPGISMEGAFMGANKMLAAGVGGEESLAFINAFSKITPDAEKFKRTMEAVGQILNKDKLSAEEIRSQLGDSTTGLNKLLKAEFGTGSAEELVKQGVTPYAFVARLAARINSDITRSGSATQAGIDNLTDAMFRLKASFGTGLAAGAIPLINKLVDKVDELVESGKLEDFGQRLSTIFGGDSMVYTIDAMIKMAEIGTYVAQVVNNIAVGFAWVGNAIFTALTAAVQFTGEIIKWSLSLTPIGNMIKMIAALAGKQLPDMGKMFGPDFANSLKQQLGGFIMGGPLGGMLSGIGNFINQADRRKKTKVEEDASLEKTAREAAERAKKETNKDASRDMASIQKQQLDYLRDIANNTKPDVTRMVLGGGNMGAWGVTGTELSDRPSRKNGNSKWSPRVNKAMYDLLDAFADDISRGRKEASRVWGV